MAPGFRRGLQRSSPLKSQSRKPSTTARDERRFQRGSRTGNRLHKLSLQLHPCLRFCRPQLCHLPKRQEICRRARRGKIRHRTRCRYCSPTLRRNRKRTIRSLGFSLKTRPGAAGPTTTTVSRHRSFAVEFHVLPRVRSRLNVRAQLYRCNRNAAA